MHQTSNNINCTNQQDQMKLEEPLMTPLEQHTNTVFADIINHKRQIETDLTGKLNVTSNRVNRYLCVLYECDRNSIFILLLKERSYNESIRVFKELHEHLLTRAIKPEYMIMYYEASPSFQRELKSKDTKLQLSPQGMYHCNPSERAISTFKYHFIAGI